MLWAVNVGHSWPGKELDLQIFNYNDMTIELFQDGLFSMNSADNKIDYGLVYCDTEAKLSLRDQAKYGIFLRNCHGEIVSSVIIIGTGGGAPSPHEKTALIKNDEIILIMGDGVICLELPSLNIKWKTTTENCYTCFEIHEIPEAYIIYAEGSIIRLNYQGEILWEFTGRDIFVMPEGSYFEIGTDTIYVKDWDGNLYELTYDGTERFTGMLN